MFIIVDLGALIIFLAILGIGLGYTIISNIGPILFMITAVIAFFGGGYIFFSGFTKKTISHQIATCVKGLMIMTIFMYTGMLRLISKRFRQMLLKRWKMEPWIRWSRIIMLS